MNDGDVKFDSVALYELVSVLAANNTTVCDYLSLCEDLWRDPGNRIWLATAMIRKVSCILLEPDPAMIEYLADKIIDDMGLDSGHTMPPKEQFIDDLPAIIQLMSDDVWHKPSLLWYELLRAVRNEYELEDHVDQAIEQDTSDSDTIEIAALFVRAIGSAWNMDLEQQLKSWQNRPEYSWLTALRDSAGLDVFVSNVKRDISMAFPLNDRTLFDRFAEMNTFERRRFLVVCYSSTREKVCPEIKMDEIARTIEWIFVIQLQRERAFEIYLQDRMISEVEMHREADGAVVVAKATGVCAPLKTGPKDKLIAQKAATPASSRMQDLTSTVKGNFRPVAGEEVVLVLKWCSLESGT